MVALEGKKLMTAIVDTHPMARSVRLRHHGVVSKLKFNIGLIWIVYEKLIKY
jgi:hypothetical protein